MHIVVSRNVDNILFNDFMIINYGTKLICAIFNTTIRRHDGSKVALVENGQEIQ